MIQVLHNVVIFPHLTYEAMMAYPFITVNDSRIAGRRLVDLIAKKIVEKDSELPDISIYDVNSKEWRDVYVPRNDTRKVRTKKETFMYYPLLVESKNLGLILSYLHSYSDADIVYSLEFKNSQEDHEIIEKLSSSQRKVSVI